MSSTDCSQSGHKTANDQQQLKFEVKSSKRKLITFLLACCFILTVFSACLLTALVLIGKHYIHTNHTGRPVPKQFDQSLKVENLTMSEPQRSPMDVEARLYRLPEGVAPIHYDITLKPNLETGVLNGAVNISVNVPKRVDYIVLNVHQLNINEVEVTKNGDVKVPVRNVAMDRRLQTMIIYFNRKLEPGRYFLWITYVGNMKNKMHGLYLSYYRTKDNIKRAITSSKFEPTYARQAFPCFDEPHLKAKFTVHILKPNDPAYFALSNMPEESSETVEDGVMVHFRESVKMSTYLVCFVICDFEHTEDVIHASTDIPFRVFASPGQRTKTQFATRIGKRVIEYFNGYFEIDFPLPKLDMIAIPDFPSGAMENWGLVTFRESGLLYDPNTSATADKQRVASVVAHEFVHSWFGNLVTMKWWSDLWLSEGFATYIFFKGLDEVLNEEWKMMDQFVIERMHAVLKIDSTLSSHPIVQNVLTPDEITSIFDTISYNKGGAVLRMLEDAISEDSFRTGVTNYLKAHAYSNAETNDFWNELGHLTQDVDVHTFMKTWTVQMGYPVLNVRTKNDSYVLTQYRYLTDPDVQDTTTTPYNYKWVIPVTYITDENSTSVLIWFQYDDHEIEIAKPTNARWVKFNYKQVGLYRVNYEGNHWRQLIKNVLEMEIADRAHLIEETFALAESGHIGYEIPLNLSRYLANELEYVPWGAFEYVMLPFVQMLRNSDVLDKFNKYVQKLVEPAYYYYTWTEKDLDKHLDRRARVKIIRIACLSDLTHCTNTASKLFIEWLEGKIQSIPQDLRAIVYCYGMKYSPVGFWNKLFDKFVAENDASEKNRLMQGLASVRDTTYLTKLLELGKTEKYIRSQDYFNCIAYVASNPIGTPLVWDYVRENWPKLVERFTLNDRILGRTILAITSTYSTQTKLEEMHAFFGKYPEAGAGEASRRLATEQVQHNIKWIRKYKKAIESWIVNEKL